jgi:hypothetical protein
MGHRALSPSSHGGWWADGRLLDERLQASGGCGGGSKTVLLLYLLDQLLAQDGDISRRPDPNPYLTTISAKNDHFDVSANDDGLSGPAA